MRLFKRYCRWLVIGLAAAISVVSFPRNVDAQPERIEVTVQVYGEVTQDFVQRRAESMAREALNEAFAQNTNTSEVVLVVSADRNGQIVPLFSVDVSRAEWQEQPNLDQWIAWATPSFSSETLLALREDSFEEPSSGPTLPLEPVRVTDPDQLENDPAFRDD